MRNFSANHVIGDNFVKLLDLHPESIILYCTLYSFVISPTGLFANVDLKNDDPSNDPCISISINDIIEQLNTTEKMAKIAILELYETGLITVEYIDENECVYLLLHELPAYCLERCEYTD